ncbi:MAG: hypothetical protein AB7F99_05820 [Vicinamibacterales bacterium]
MTNLFDSLRGVASVLGVLLFAASAAAQTPLPAKPAQGRTPADGAAEYVVAAKTAGILTVATNGDEDLILQVTDQDGQAIEDGRSDQDLNGSSGNELVSVVLPEPGSYRVRVTAYDDDPVTFEIVGSFLSMPAFESVNSDPDRRPGQARAVEVGRANEDSVDSEDGDNWDWFVLKPAEAGSLVILTRRAPNGGDADLRLEVFLDGNYAEPAESSDNDLQNDNANESVTINVAAGQPVHVKVSMFSSGSTRYQLSSSLVP